MQGALPATGSLPGERGASRSIVRGMVCAGYLIEATVDWYRFPDLSPSGPHQLNSVALMSASLPCCCSVTACRLHCTCELHMLRRCDLSAVAHVCCAWRRLPLPSCRHGCHPALPDFQAAVGRALAAGQLAACKENASLISAILASGRSICWHQAAMPQFALLYWLL